MGDLRRVFQEMWEQRVDIRMRSMRPSVDGSHEFAARLMRAYISVRYHIPLKKIHCRESRSSRLIMLLQGREKICMVMWVKVDKKDSFYSRISIYRNMGGPWTRGIVKIAFGRGRGKSTHDLEIKTDGPAYILFGFPFYMFLYGETGGPQMVWSDNSTGNAYFLPEVVPSPHDYC